MRRAISSLGLIGILVTAATLASPLPSDASSKAVSPVQLLNQSITAANTAASMHFIDRSSSGKLQQALAGAVSAPTASESLKQTGQPPLQIMLISDTIYVNAGTQVLQGQLGLSAAASTANAGKWIAVQSGDSAFSQLAPLLTVSSELNTFVPTSFIRMGKVVKVAGQKVIPITGRPSSTVANGGSGSVALLVSTTSPHYPVGGSLVLARRGQAELREVAVFSAWGQPISLTPPTSSVPFSSLVS